MVESSFGVGVVHERRYAVAGRFAEPDVALYDGVEYQFAEVLFQFFLNLVAQSQTGVVHGEQETFDFEVGVEPRLDSLAGFEPFSDAFQGELSGLYG